MVSLINDHRSPRGGFFFNTENSEFDDPDDASIASTVLITDNEPRIKTFSFMGWALVFIQNITVIAVIVSPFLIIHLSATSSFYLYITHVGLWCLLTFTSCCLSYYHSAFKRSGYLEFHRKTQMLPKVPFIVLSFGNAVLLLLATLLNIYCPDSNDACPSGSTVRGHDYSLMIYCAEFLVLLPFSVKYLLVITRFCRSKNVPDVHHDELLINCIHSHSPVNEIGFKDEDYREEILERQADMIRYLKQHNIHLSRKILKLTTELNSYKISAEIA